MTTGTLRSDQRVLMFNNFYTLKFFWQILYHCIIVWQYIHQYRLIPSPRFFFDKKMKKIPKMEKKKLFFFSFFFYAIYFFILWICTLPFIGEAKPGWIFQSLSKKLKLVENSKKCVTKYICARCVSILLSFQKYLRHLKKCS